MAHLSGGSLAPGSGGRGRGEREQGGGQGTEAPDFRPLSTPFRYQHKPGEASDGKLLETDGHKKKKQKNFLIFLYS